MPLFAAKADVEAQVCAECSCILPAVRLRWERASRVHVIAVHDVRPLEGELHSFEPFFVALCTCDAQPKVRSRESQAREDADQHARQTGGQVEPGLRRPVG